MKVLIPLFLLFISNFTTPQNQTAEFRIVGGRTVSIRHYPYHLSLRLNNRHHCGAALVTPSAAVTGGHCIAAPPEFYSVRAGTPFINKGGVVVPVRRIAVHPRYNKVDYDVAVVVLRSSLSPGPNIMPIELPRNNPVPGSMGMVTGWGTRVPGARSLTVRLRGVNVPVMEQRVCRECYWIDSITERMLCAGYLLGGKDACQGDSGGPLTVDGRLVGIVSWGIDCAQPFYPGVYTRVFEVLPFIKRFMP